MHGSANNDAEYERLERIVLANLWPSSAHLINFFGRFRRGELCYVSAPDLAISWTRTIDQTPDVFEEMVCNSILEMRGLPPIDTVERRGGCKEAARHLASYHRTARAHH